MEPRVFPHARGERLGAPFRPPRGGSRLTPHTERGPARPPQRPRGTGPVPEHPEHRQPHRAPTRAPTPAPARAPSDARVRSLPLPPPQAPGTFQKLPLVPGALRRRLARPALRHPSLRHGSATPRGPASQGRGRPRRHREPRGAGGGTGSPGSRGQEEQKKEAGPAAPPLLTPPGRGRAPAPAAARRMRFCRGITALLWCPGARVGLHVLEMRWRVSAGKYGNAGCGRALGGIYGNGDALTGGKYRAARWCPSLAPRPRLWINHIKDINHRIT